MKKQTLSEWKVFKDPEVLIYYEDLIRTLLRVRDNLNIPWDETMDEIMKIRDEIYEEVKEEMDLERAMKILDEDLV